jgi:hypothetical protein
MGPVCSSQNPANQLHTLCDIATEPPDYKQTIQCQPRTLEKENENQQKRKAKKKTTMQE